MFTVGTISCSEYIKDGSTFIAYLIPYNTFDNHLIYLKKEHKKAVHFTKASRVINTYSHILESHSDDGEPKGSAGIPILNVMRGNNLVDCGIIVVRYFGGKLLGIGGLVRAYTSASLAVVCTSKLILFEEIIEYDLNVNFRDIELIKHMCNKNEINIIKFSFMQNFVIIKLQASRVKIDNLLLTFNK